jgi:hypothetical protein
LSTSSRPDIFFETVGPAHRPLLARYLRRGHRIFVYDFTYRLKSWRWLAGLIDVGRVERIYIDPLSRADHEAIKATEWLYPRWAHHPLARRLGAIFGQAEAETVLKKALVEAIFPYCFIRLDLERRRHPGEVVLVSDSYRQWEDAVRAWEGGLPPLAGVRIARSASLWSAAAGGFRRRVQTARVAVATLLHAARAKRAARGAAPVSPRAFDHVYAIDQPFQTKFQGGRRFDFLVDGDLLTAKNTAFLVTEGADGSWMDQAREAGFEILRRTDYAGLRWMDDRQTRRSRVPLLLLAALRPGVPGWLSAAAVTAAAVLLRDVPFLEAVTFRNYLYTNQDTVLQAWRNALLRLYGARSWCFTLAIGGGYLYTDDPEAEHRYWAHQNPDHLVTASRQLVEYHRRHPQRVAHYHNVGNIWSELVLDVERRVGRDALRREWFADAAAGLRVVSWFDTSFVQSETSPSTYDEAIAWYSDIERFLEDFPDVGVVIKPSKDEVYFVDMQTQWADIRGRRLMEIWQRLRAHPRVHFAGHRGDPTSIIAGSDLVVTYCFSSISAEALGAGHRALWYEPGQRWRQTLYGRVPGLVTHGYAELLARARTLLYDTDERQYRDYLDRDVRGVMEDFLDGRGLTRFRQLLTGSGARA